MKKILILYLTIVYSFLIFSCKEEDKSKTNTTIQQQETSSLKQQIEDLLKQNAVVIDVRTPEEFEMGHFKNALNIPYDQIEQHIKELEKFKDKTIIVYCRSGRRSGIAKKILEMNGFKNIVNGINLNYFPQDQIVK